MARMKSVQCRCSRRQAGACVKQFESGRQWVRRSRVAHFAVFDNRQTGVGLSQMGSSQESRKRTPMDANESGPAPQLAPMADAPSASMRLAACSGVAPIMVRSLFLPVSKAKLTSTGRPVLRAARRAMDASSRSLKVSRIRASGLASARAALCRVKGALRRLRRFRRHNHLDGDPSRRPP